MKNYIQKGDVITIVAAAAIESGDAVVVGAKVGVAVADAGIGESVAVALEGVYELPKKAADTIDQGQAVYWDADPGEITETSTDHILAGYAWVAAGAATTTVQVRLVG
jgi:predicted RecA/RadA family phage recombinase